MNPPDKRPNLFVATLSVSLSQGGSDGTIFVSSITTFDGQAISTSDFQFFGIGYIAVDVQSATRAEFISFTGVDPVAKSFTGAVRGLSFKDSTVIPANKKFHAVGAPVIISFGTQDIINIENELIYLYNLIGSAVITGALPASATQMGITRLSENSSVNLGNPTIPISTPSAALIHLVGSNLTVNDIIVFSTTGALPTGITAGTPYYVLSTGLTADDFKISLTPGGTAVITSGTQSGTQTLTKVTPVAVGTNDPRLSTITPSNPVITEFDTTNSAWIRAATISFVSATKTIADSGSGFVAAHFRAGDAITVTGSGSNDGTYTIVSVAAGALVVAQSLLNESVGATIVVTSVFSSKLIRVPTAGRQIPYFGPYGGSLAGTDTYAITVPGITAYTQGDSYIFKADVQNTGPATLNVNSLGAITIKKNVSQDLGTGDILAGQFVQVGYDATTGFFQLQSVSANTVPAIFNLYNIGADPTVKDYVVNEIPLIPISGATAYANGYRITSNAGPSAISLAPLGNSSSGFQELFNWDNTKIVLLEDTFSVQVGAAGSTTGASDGYGFCEAITDLTFISNAKKIAILADSNGILHGVTSDGVATTSTSLGVSYSNVSKGHRCTIVWDPITPKVDFWIDGFLVGTNTTNIPNTTGATGVKVAIYTAIQTSGVCSGRFTIPVMAQQI